MTSPFQASVKRMQKAVSILNRSKETCGRIMEREFPVGSHVSWRIRRSYAEGKVKDHDVIGQRLQVWNCITNKTYWVPVERLWDV